ncbi:hypothetical protein [Paraburkholderia pallida]|uniref:Uncharacterized protein n=1 Tax=Paraburkholderia pallida TaxID=2547399 RepID=A0A4P7CUT5_9BURK|nr:hypothetical protein [Paraburkholderia pallida]QBQ97861.1 hypothetical protein E1956_12195 [Paraburkholderia pallida]
MSGVAIKFAMECESFPDCPAMSAEEKWYLARVCFAAGKADDLVRKSITELATLAHVNVDSAQGYTRDFIAWGVLKFTGDYCGKTKRIPIYKVTPEWASGAALIAPSRAATEKVNKAKRRTKSNTPHGVAYSPGEIPDTKVAIKTAKYPTPCGGNTLHGVASIPDTVSGINAPLYIRGLQDNQQGNDKESDKEAVARVNGHDAPQPLAGEASHVAAQPATAVACPVPGALPDGKATPVAFGAAEGDARAAAATASDDHNPSGTVAAARVFQRAAVTASTSQPTHEIPTRANGKWPYEMAKIAKRLTDEDRADPRCIAFARRLVEHNGGGLPSTPFDQRIVAERLPVLARADVTDAEFDRAVARAVKHYGSPTWLGVMRYLRDGIGEREYTTTPQKAKAPFDRPATSAGTYVPGNTTRH